MKKYEFLTFFILSVSSIQGFNYAMRPLISKPKNKHEHTSLYQIWLQHVFLLFQKNQHQNSKYYNIFTFYITLFIFYYYSNKKNYHYKTNFFHFFIPLFHFFYTKYSHFSFISTREGFAKQSPSNHTNSYFFIFIF